MAWNPYLHNHASRNVLPYGQCRACDFVQQDDPISARDAHSSVSVEYSGLPDPREVTTGHFRPAEDVQER